MRGLVLALLAAFAAALPARAEVYRCVHDGHVTYTDRACAPGAPSQQLPPPNLIGPPTAAERDLARAADQRLSRETSSRHRADAEWVKGHQQKAAHAEKVHSAIVEHRVVEGMTEGEVRSAVGEPERVAESESYGTGHATWTYRDDRGTRSVIFKNGEVSRVGRTARTRRGR
ncbi:MAG TPA: DUF4124 domain-containing protein [Candidatus Binatia bacterium]|nr:DUF4124 domain-containing protein [Candidatus Binatia bacterium]